MIVYVVFLSCIILGGFAFASGFLDSHLANANGIVSLSRDIRGLALGVSSVSLVILILLTFKRMRTFGVVFLALNAFSVSVVLGLMLHVHVIDRFNTTKELAKTIKEAGEDQVIVNYRSFDETLPFYLGRRTYLAEFTGEWNGSKIPRFRGVLSEGGRVSQIASV